MPAIRKKRVQGKQKLLKDDNKDDKPKCPVNLIKGLYNFFPKALALDNEKLIRQQDYIFNHEIVPQFEITDQWLSGRCWIFATLNMIRIIGARNMDFPPKEFELSTSYIFFYDRLERYKHALCTFITLKCSKTYSPDYKRIVIRYLCQKSLDDGGEWLMACNLVNKYGIVPQKLMPDSTHLKYSSQMRDFLINMLCYDLSRLDKMGCLPISQYKSTVQQMVEKVKTFLIAFMGKPPTVFDFTYKDISGNIVTLPSQTPFSFLEQTGFKTNEWVTLVDDARKKPGLYEKDLISNMIDKPLRWLVVPTSRLQSMSNKMLQNGLPVWIGCSFNNDIDIESGVMDYKLHDFNTAFNIDIDMSKQDRLNFPSTSYGHAMVIVGYHSNKDEIIRYKVENSYGTKMGKNGYLLMTPQWFREYVYESIVHINFLTKSERDMLSKVPTKVTIID